MTYNDKEIQIAAQISYITITEDMINDYINDHGDYPTLKYLLNKNEKMLEVFYKMFFLGYTEEKANDEFAYKVTEKLNKEREKIAKSDIQLLQSGDFSCSDWKVIQAWDFNDTIGLYAILFETSDNCAVLAFRGSEIIPDDNGTQLRLDWVEADFGLLDCLETKQQKKQEKLLMKYRKPIITTNML